GFSVGKLLLLQARISRHAFLSKAPRQLEHAVVQRVETGQSDELEFVSHSRQFALEPGDGGIVELAFPVERRRAVVSEHFARELCMNALGETARLFEIRF